MVEILSRLRGKAATGLSQAGLLGLYLRNFRKVRSLSLESLLSAKNHHGYHLSYCPICGSADYHPLIRLPFGDPTGQVHSICYFDYKTADLPRLLLAKDLLDRTFGFVLSVTWNFCNCCRNGSLPLALNQEHLNTYYSQYYVRDRPIDPRRRTTKELHGRYLCRLLPPGSRILEIGAADGFTAGYVASQGHEVLVYEPSANYQDQLNQTSSITNLPELSGVDECSLDAIYMHHVFEHIASPLEYATSLFRLLKPGGLLLIQVPDLSLQVVHHYVRARRSVYSLFNKPILFRGQTDYDFWSPDGSYDWGEALLNDHVTAFTPEGIKYVIESCGFEIEHISQSTAEKIVYKPEEFAWPVDPCTGNTPNSITVVARR